jgi:hypothetical protein
MTTGSGFITDEHTAALQKVIREVQNDPSTYLGSKYLPSVALPARKIRIDIIEATGGLTQEHTLGTDPLYTQRFGTRSAEFEPGSWREAIRYDEQDILNLRELGQNDTSRRGIEMYIEKTVDQLNRRLEARIEKLRWDAIFTGSFQYLGKTISFGIPSGNRVTPSVPWFTGTQANNSADPLKDIRFWTTGGQANFRKYKIKEMVMNPNTARVILDNANTQSFIKTYFSSEAFGAYDLNKVLQMYLPGCPPVTVYDGWYQDQTLDNATGKLSVGDAIFFIPDGYIFFTIGTPDNDALGEFHQGLHLASGTIGSPGYGKFLVIEDNTAPGTKGGPKNPFIDLVAGVAGGPKLDRYFDILTAYVGE